MESEVSAQSVSKIISALGSMQGALWVVGLVFGLLVLKAAFVGMSLWMNVTFPRFASHALELYRTPGTRCFWLGLVNALVVMLISGFLVNAPPLIPIAFFLMLALGIGIVAGYGAAYRSLGALVAPRAAESHAYITRAHVLGATAAEAAFMLPVLGPLLSFGMLCRGLGAVILALAAMRRESRYSAVTQTAQAAVAMEDES